MSLKYRIAFTVFVLEAAMMSAVLVGIGPPLQPDAIVLAEQLQSARERIIVIALTGMSLIAVAGITIGFLLTRRLHALAAAAERLTAGEAGVRVNFQGRDEIARLGHAFDRMADEIDNTLAELRSSEARNRVLVEHCPAAIFVFDPEAFRLVDVNQKWVELLKYPRERIVGMTPLQASPPFQAGGRATDDVARELVVRTFAGEHPTAPWILRDSTGRDFPCELQLTRYPEAHKNLIIGIIYDVSERERLAKALDRRIAFEDLLVRLSARLIALKPDQIDQSLREALAEIGRFAGVDRSYVFEFDAERQQESCTYEWCASGIQPAMQRLQNLPLADFPWFMERIGKGEVLHVPSVRGLPPEAAAERAEFEAEGIQSVIMVPLRFEGEVSGYMGFDAVSRTLEWPAEIVMLLRIAGEIVFSALHRKRAELALGRQTAALEQANDALERSNEELKQFAYVASHDLREPLRAIAGFSGLLASRYRGRLEPDADEYIGFITDAATRMHNMINDLLSYSRIDAQAEPARACDMHQMLKLAQANLLTSITEQHARISHDVLPVVKADPTQMVQLLQNLVGNAIKFHGKAPPLVHLGVQRRNAAEWEFTVSDNGIGIDPRQADSIFQIFRRLHDREEYPGTGIGLAVCKRIVERHGGRIWCDANEGGGSRFHFTLPALT